MPKGSLKIDNNKPKSCGKYPINVNKSSESIACHLKSSLYGRNIMDSELLLTFIGHFPDYLSALSRTLLRFFWTTFVETAVYHYPSLQFNIRVFLLCRFYGDISPATWRPALSAICGEGKGLKELDISNIVPGLMRYALMRFRKSFSPSFIGNFLLLFLRTSFLLSFQPRTLSLIN